MNEVDATEEKIRLYQHKLDHEIIPYKEMEYLREQVILLRARMDPLADEALGLSEEVERDAQRLREAEAKHKARQTALEEDLSGLEQRREALLKEKETLLSEREERSAQVAAHLRQHYERLLRSTHSPVVPVAGGTCGGCHLRLSESTLTRVKEEREVVTCENCSRFLYWRSR